MSKIKIEQTGLKRATITLPPELINYIVNKPVYYSRYVLFALQDNCDLKGNVIGFWFIISNFYYDKNGNSNNYSRQWSNSKTRNSIKKDNTISISCQKPLTSIVNKSNGRQGICNTYKVDYKIYEDDNYYSIVSYFGVKNTIQFPNNEVNGFYHHITNVFNRYSHSDFLVNLKMSKNCDEFYHCIGLDDNGSIIYVNKDKFIDIILKNRISAIDFRNSDSLLIFKNNTRIISLSKLCARLYPEHDPKILQAYLEYTKMLSNYDESLFSIVTGNDIVKYYHHTNYFKNSGDLGSSCMRNDSNVKSIEFYAKNSNVSLIIMKPKDLDSIMARALVWTTVDGHKVMDRIYTCDSKLVSLFHRYAEDNNFINIYNVRKFNGSVRNLMSMSPGNWLNEYDKNFTVDLDYLPAEFEMVDSYHKFYASYNNRRTSTSDNWKFPYMDNFNLINSVTKQASVMTIKDTFICELTGTFINVDNLLEHDYHIYNKHLVKIGNYGPELIHEDVVTLDAPINTCDTSVNIPAEVPDDTDSDDWNWEEEEEELDWDGLENITEQITNEQSYNTLDSSVITRIIEDVTITNNNNV